jgi:cholesterol transport system auxiliary component
VRQHVFAPSFIGQNGGERRSFLRPALRAAALALAGVMLGACGGGNASLPTFDLYAPRDVGPTGTAYTQLTVNEPIVVQAFDSDRVVVKDQAGTISYLGGAQWVDKLPRLFQTRLIETFENAKRTGVGRPGGGIIANTSLVTEIRSFQIEGASGEALVEVSAKLVTAFGRVNSARVFAARVPAGSADGPAAARALDQASSQVMTEIVRWATGARGA